LDPDEIRCVALVGHFLQAWSAMELALRDAIGAALKIEPVQLQILCANIRFRDKTDILRTLVDVSSFADDEKRRAKSKIRKLGSHAGKRNMLAHDPFEAHGASKGVQFLTVRAKGEYETPSPIWSLHRFKEEDHALHGYTKFLDCLGMRFKQRPLTKQNYVDALRPYLDMNMGMGWRQVDTPLPLQQITGLASSNSLSQLDQARPGYGPASSEETAQTPDKPREGDPVP